MREEKQKLSLLNASRNHVCKLFLEYAILSQRQGHARIKGFFSGGPGSTARKSIFLAVESNSGIYNGGGGGGGGGGTL